MTETLPGGGTAAFTRPGTAPFDLNAIASSVNAASPDQIAQIVATIDRLDQRGDADRLVAPLRARLAVLGIPRQMTLRRLSFQPLDPLIVDSRVWKRGQPRVPRSALMPLFNVMRDGNPDYPHAESLLMQAPSGSLPRRELAALLWQPGARALLATAAPPDWREASGLSAADFMALRSIVAGTLGVAELIDGLISQSNEAQLAARLREIMSLAATHGALAWQAVLLLLLLANHHTCGGLALSVATAMPTTPEVAQALEPALASLRDSMRERLETLHQSGRLTPLELADISEKTLDLEKSAGARSQRRRDAEQLRQDAEQICSQSVARSINDNLLPALHRNAAMGIGDRQLAQQASEAAAREAREFMAVGLGLSSAARYDAQLRPAINQLLDPGSPLELIDRVRILEILGKPKLALELLKSRAGAG